MAWSPTLHNVAAVLYGIVAPGHVVRSSIGPQHTLHTTAMLTLGRFAGNGLLSSLPGSRTDPSDRRRQQRWKSWSSIVLELCDNGPHRYR